MATARTPSKPVTTTNLTLATLLVMRGHKPKLVKDGESKSGYPIGAWEFPDNENVRAVKSQYDQGLAKVEPRAFHDALTSTRRELFAFLGIGKKR